VLYCISELVHHGAPRRSLIISINPDSHVPIYQQIVDHIRRSVAAGVYRPGEPIPSLRQLALDLVVNPNTVQRAYEQLERDGLIQARKGLGMFVTENGAVSALTKLQAAVYSAFAEGIRAGKAARMPAQRIKTTFDRAWDDANQGSKEES
jgi:GntR family transcriptional regulator